MIELDKLGSETIRFFSLIKEEKIQASEAAFISFALKHCHTSKAQLLQDAWVLFELQCKKGGYFVEFGAADGVLFSNSHALEKYHGWHGALAEPCPDYHSDLLANRNNCFISSKGVGPKNGNYSMTIAPDNSLSTFEGFSQADHLSVHRLGGRKIDVEVQTLNEFLEGAKAPNLIDFLSIDTEGSEFSILELFDWKKYQIRTICVEHNYVPQRENIYRLLVDKGYKRCFERLSLWDDWYRLVEE